MELHTKLTYDESVINHSNAWDIITKQERIAAKYFLDGSVTVRIDSESTIFYDIKLWIKTCKLNPTWDTFGTYLHFQFVPSDKYFAMKMGENNAMDEYKPENVEFYDTSLCAILNLVNSIIPSWQNINDYLNAVRMVALREFNQYNPKDS